MDQKKLLVSMALSGMLGACETSPSESESLASNTMEAQGECHGINSCKGTGECGGKGYSCAGKNSCKGKGWLSMTKAVCKEKSGSFKPEGSSHH